jgi:hypothetical protein
MANTLTSLIPEITTALDVVSREKVGMITAVSADPQTERAAIGQTVRSHVAPAASATTNTPGLYAPDTGDQNIGNVSLAITASKHVPVRFNGEETKGLMNAGRYSSLLQDRFAQAFRTLANEIESDLCELYVGASRAHGTAGTAPFGTANNLTDFAGVNRILDDNGAPNSDRQLVLGSAAFYNLRGIQSGLFSVNQAGSADLLRTGITDLVQGFALRYSGQVQAHTKGAGTGYDVDNNPAGYVVGDTTIHLDGGTANTTGIKAGDVITFAGDTNKYIVTTGTGDNAEADIVLGAPGLRATLADAVEGAVGNSYTANMAFTRNAIVLATRMPALPDGGDAATDVVTVVDPVSGLVYEVAEYKQFLQTVYHVRIAWGVKMVKPEHCAILLG